MIVDLIAYSTIDMLDNLLIENMRNDIVVKEGIAPPKTLRFVLPLLKKVKTLSKLKNLISLDGNHRVGAATAKRSGKKIIVTPAVLSSLGMEFPKLNDNFIGRKYHYFYSSGPVGPQPSSKLRMERGNTICKVNVETLDVVYWEENEFTFPGEPYFVPNPNGLGEDDGIVIAAVSDCRSTGKDFLVFLDGKSFEEVGRAEFNARIPLSGHGIFMHDFP